MILSTHNDLKYDPILSRLLKALSSIGLGERGRGAKIAKDTGYSPNQVSWMLSGKTPLNDRFLKLLCSSYHISEEWLRGGGGNMMKVADLTSEYHVDRIFTGVTTEEKALLDMVHEDKELLKDVIKYTQEKKLLKELLKEKLEKRAG